MKDEEKDSEAICLEAEKAFDSEDYELAFSLYQKSADLGNVWSMNALGIMYGGGYVQPVDNLKSLEWHMKAFEKDGSSSLCINIGITYRNMGEIAKSKEWFLKALEKGDDEAALELAKLYMVSEKEVETVRYYLNHVINGTNVCENSVEEATALLASLDE